MHHIACYGAVTATTLLLQFEMADCFLECVRPNQLFVTFVT